MIAIAIAAVLMTVAERVWRHYRWETVLAEVALAESDRKRAEDRLEWSSRMYQKGYVSKAQNLSDRFSLDQKVLTHERALTKRNAMSARPSPKQGVGRASGPASAPQGGGEQGPIRR